MRPRTAFSLVTTRAPIFFARSQSAALLMLASGAIVVTSVPFRLRMLSMDTTSPIVWPSYLEMVKRLDRSREHFPHVVTIPREVGGPYHHRSAQQPPQ